MTRIESVGQVINCVAGTKGTEQYMCDSVRVHCPLHVLCFVASARSLSLLWDGRFCDGKDRRIDYLNLSFV